MLDTSRVSRLQSTVLQHRVTLHNKAGKPYTIPTPVGWDKPNPAYRFRDDRAIFRGNGWFPSLSNLPVLSSFNKKSVARSVTRWNHTLALTPLGEAQQCCYHLHLKRALCQSIVYGKTFLISRSVHPRKSNLLIIRIGGGGENEPASCLNTS